MKVKEKIIEFILKFCASITILTTVGIIAVLLFESIAFFKSVSIFEFLTDTQWTPLYSEKHFGILALVSGTFLTAAIAIAVAIFFEKRCNLCSFLFLKHPFYLIKLH